MRFDITFCYKIRVKKDDRTFEIPVCYKALLSINGITKGKVEHLQQALKNTGTAPNDKRGQHSSKIKKLPDTSYQHVFDHISSFKGRLSHYRWFKKTLPLWRAQHKKDVWHYQAITFNRQYILQNLLTRFSRSNKCSICDKFTTEINILRTKGNPEATVAIQKTTTKQDSKGTSQM